jgi:hypothetical protein
MGVFHLFSTASKPGDTIRPGNPNPAKFTVVRSQQCGRHLVALLRYAGVTNYEGSKILVFLDKDEVWLRSRIWLDPHFQENKNESPFARFEPTESGWWAAVDIAERLWNV